MRIAFSDDRPDLLINAASGSQSLVNFGDCLATGDILSREADLRWTAGRRLLILGHLVTDREVDVAVSYST